MARLRKDDVRLSEWQGVVVGLPRRVNVQTLPAALAREHAPVASRGKPAKNLTTLVWTGCRADHRGVKLQDVRAPIYMSINIIDICAVSMLR